jgi:hypothetical protein
MDCAICIEPMNTKNYILPNGSDDTLDDTDSKCLRLKCGHAFHADCTLATFRAGMGCPTCREPLREEAGFDEDDDDLSEDNDPVLTRLDIERERIRARSKPVKEARREFNKSLRDYKAHCAILKAERKLFIRKALEDFRRKRREEYNKVSLRVMKRMKEVEKTEIAELSKHSTKEEIIFYQSASQFDYSAREAMRSNDYTTADPISNVFWKI